MAFLTDLLRKRDRRYDVNAVAVAAAGFGVLLPQAPNVCSLTESVGTADAWPSPSRTVVFRRTALLLEPEALHR